MNNWILKCVIVGLISKDLITLKGAVGLDTIMKFPILFD